ncbi:MAG: polysaccharide deacetylase family protein [Candidatus Omnitrophota bacterium]
MIRNVFTVDLEDWCHSIYLQKAAVSFSEARVIRNTDALSSVLDQYGVRATFFVLGQIAERIPELVRKLHHQGHEIASHGYGHQVLSTMQGQEVLNDIQTSCRILENVTGTPVKGYRAPAWSLPRERRVLIESLSSCGIEYDSSCAAFSVPFVWRATGNTADPFWLDSSQRIMEIPPTSVSLGLARVPVAGGAALRLYPYEVTRRLVAWCNSRGRAVVLYVHPWDLDVDFSPLPLPWPQRVFHYAGRHTVLQKLVRLMKEFSFCTMAEYFQAARKKGLA